MPPETRESAFNSVRNFVPIAALQFRNLSRESLLHSALSFERELGIQPVNGTVLAEGAAAARADYLPRTLVAAAEPEAPAKGGLRSRTPAT